MSEVQKQLKTANSQLSSLEGGGEKEAAGRRCCILHGGAELYQNVELGCDTIRARVEVLTCDRLPSYLLK